MLWSSEGILQPTPKGPLVSRLTLIAVVLAGVFTVACDDDEERTLTVFAAASLSDVFEAIGTRFESEQRDVRVRFSFGGSQRLRLQLEQGAHADLFASANPEQIDHAHAGGLVEDGRTFASNALALVVPAANPAGIATLDDLTKAGVRLVVAGPTVPAGVLTRSVLAELGVVDGVLAGVVSEEESVRRVLAKVELGEADAGFVYSTGALAAGNAVLQIPLEETGMRNGYLIAITTDTDDPELADRFRAFLNTEVARSILSAAGFGVPDVGTP